MSSFNVSMRSSNALESVRFQTADRLLCLRSPPKIHTYKELFGPCLFHKLCTLVASRTKLRTLLGAIYRRQSNGRCLNRHRFQRRIAFARAGTSHWCKLTKPTGRYVDRSIRRRILYRQEHSLDSAAAPELSFQAESFRERTPNDSPTARLIRIRGHAMPCLLTRV